MEQDVHPTPDPSPSRGGEVQRINSRATVPGRRWHVSDDGDPGALGIDFSTPINHAMPDRRAPHDVLESSHWANWLSRDRLP